MVEYGSFANVPKADGSLQDFKCTLYVSWIVMVEYVRVTNVPKVDELLKGLIYTLYLAVLELYCI